jgi:hypothetical protein
MGRNKLPPTEKKVRLDIYIKQGQKDLIIKNKLQTEIDIAINKICEDLKTKKNV